MKLPVSTYKYLSVGVVNTIFALFVIYCSKWILGCDDVLANAFGYGAGITLSFILNKKWTFQHSGRIAQSLAKYVFVIAIAYVSNLGLVMVCITILNINSYLSQAIGIGPYTIIGYLGSRYFVFQES